MRLNQVTASARDLTASTAFYQALGLTLIVQADHYVRFECPDTDAGRPRPSRCISIPTRSGWRRRWSISKKTIWTPLSSGSRPAGLVFESDQVDQRWLWREAWLRDPTGNRVCLYKAGEARRFPPWRVE